ncbi:TonB-dependent receptor [Ulvibacterium sp.]|uniref:TonB-dependent receptor domain-containing protein n=1 Tax=Ulvibacterium sp. TaxID=2665914 RepID=UPI0026083AA5|nr:TonB-dependent receptor [Ulvibacterium sp.]
MKRLKIPFLKKAFEDQFLRTVWATILMLLYVHLSNAQLSGKVMDKDSGIPLVGATVSLEGNTYYGVTDFDGNYIISDIPDGTYSAICSFIGYKNLTLEIEISGSATLNFDLEVDLLQMDEVVVTGVASKTSKAVAGIAVQRINADELVDKSAYNGVDDLLSGKIAGVSLQKSGGGFGSGTRFVVRSGGGINGNGQPLIFIDGVRMDNSTSAGAGGGAPGVDPRGSGGISSLVGLNPEDIANVEVIKGPAGSATYGTGAANGVILITTKRGNASGWEVNYRGTLGFHEVGNTLDDDSYVSNEFLRDNVFRTGAIFKNSVNVSAGNEIFRSFFSLDRNQEDGMTPDNEMRQTSTRLNFDFTPSNKINLKSSAQYSSTDILLPQRGRGDGEFGYLSFNPANYDPEFDPIRPAFFRTSSDDNNVSNFVASLQGKYSPFADSDGLLSGLSANFTVGVTDRRENSVYVQRRTSEAIEGLEVPGEIWVSNEKSTDFTFTNNLAFNYSFGKFSGSAQVGSQIFSERSRRSLVVGQDLLSGFATLNSAATIFPPTENGFHAKSAGIFASNELSFDEKFFTTLMIRRDYSSVLGNLAPSITYPAASFVVRWDKFDFTPDFFSFLKTRFAYGESGTLPNLTAGIPFLYSPGASQYGVGLNLSSVGNPLLEPERSKQFEVGLEAEVGNFGLELTYYNNKATKSLVPRPEVPSSGLYEYPSFVNVGSVQGSGVELSLNASFAGKALGGWRASFTFLGAYQENEVTDLGFDGQIQGGPGGGTQVFRTGLPRGAYVNNVTIGALFSDGTNVQNIDYLPNFGEVVPAGELYDFVNSDGPVFIGVNNPEYITSLATNISIGNFNFYALLEAKTGFVVYNEQTIDQIFFGLDTDFFNGLGTNYPEFNRLYQKLGYGDFNTGEAVLTPGTQAYIDAADQFASMSPFNDANGIQKGNFLKLREVSLSYDFRDLISNSKLIKGLTLGIAASNVYTWLSRKASRHTVQTLDGQNIERWISGYSGTDPESNAGAFTSNPSTGVQSGQLPPSRTLTTFLSVKF